MLQSKELLDLSSLMLSGVKVKYGRDSNEYEMVGGCPHPEWSLMCQLYSGRVKFLLFIEVTGVLNG
ncbi:hypothetical protein [Candidatus Electrothrix sp.]|uniref:hypothetical protein n=1 Tax=Candidatus Electrothrix sp. TaxID=2170559 RepID=UPI004055C93E